MDCGEKAIEVSVVGVWKFIKRYEEDGTIARRPGSGSPSVITQEVAAIVENQMQTTAIQLRRILAAEGHALSLITIQRSQTHLGWTFRGSVYCQLICDANKEKRLHWSRENL